MHLLIGAACFAVMLLVSALMLSAWVVSRIVTFVWRAATGRLGTEISTRDLLGAQTLPSMCRRDGCHAANPTDARFCRRCGVALEPVVRQKVVASKKDSSARRRVSV